MAGLDLGWCLLFLLLKEMLVGSPALVGAYPPGLMLVGQGVMAAALTHALVWRCCRQWTLWGCCWHCCLAEEWLRLQGAATAAALLCLEDLRLRTGGVCWAGAQDLSWLVALQLRASSWG